MKQIHRTILFITLALIFIVFAPILILHTQGYRVDFKSKRIIQTGGFFFEVSPRQAEIYLDNVFYRKTNFFFNTILIENLLPKKYNVKIRKDDYIAWEKNLTINEKEVTEVKNILLFPSDFNFQPISKEVQDFWVSPTEEKIIWKEIDDSSWSLKLYNLNKELKSHLVNEKEISRNPVDFLNLEFSPQEEKIYFQVILAEQLKTFGLNINRGLSSLAEEEQPEINPEIVAYQSFSGENYYLDSEGNFYKTKEELTKETISEQEKINNSLFPIKKEIPYRLYLFPETIFLKEGNIVYFFDQQKKEFTKFEENIRDFKLSPDSKTIAYFFDTEIWILPIEKTKNYEAQKEVFLLRLSESIQDVLWIHPNYLAFNTENRLKIAEIDNRDQLNIIDLGVFESSKIFWSSRTKRLYILAGQTLWHSTQLIP